MTPRLASVAALLLLGVACGDGAPGDTASDGDTDTTGEQVDYTDVECGREPALTYDNFGDSFMTRYCTACHTANYAGDDRYGAPEGVNFDTYDDVKAHARLIQAFAIGDDPPMPPGGGPSTEEKLKLSEWLTCTVIPEAEGS